MITLGHGVEADADIWESIVNVESKDDWAYGALLSVFGAESKFFRARTPRVKDHCLRVFPSSPPVIPVLKHFYKKWLKDHIAVIDHECGLDYMKETDEEVQDWESFLEEECPEDRTERRKAKLSHLVKRLPALMADKATNMYRQGNRSKQSGVIDVEDINIKEEYESDHSNCDSPVEIDIIDDNSSSSSLSPHSSNYFRDLMSPLTYSDHRDSDNE